MFPEVSAIVTAEFWIIFPVVPSNRATALSVELQGHVTSPEPHETATKGFPGVPVPVIVTPSPTWSHVFVQDVLARRAMSVSFV